MRYVPFQKFVGDLQSKYTLLPDSALTPKERRFMESLETAAWDLSHFGRDRHDYRRDKWRSLRVGISDTADGWTDGATYIAINRKFLKDNLAGRSENFGNLVMLLTHEYCHDDDDSGTHVHAMEFYKKYHEMTRIAPRVQAKAFSAYIRRMEMSGKDLPRAAALHVIRNGMASEVVAEDAA